MSQKLRVALPLLLFAMAAPGEDDDPAAAARNGEFQVTFTISEVVGADAARNLDSVLSADEPITWELYVPDSYQAAKPAGLMVYISPSRSGEIPRSWKTVMDQRNMIWIAANGAGNRVEVVRRAAYALVARTLAGTHYRIDPERIYLSGFSGGGKVASMVATDYALWFKGAIYNCGAELRDELPPKQLELIQQHHYVFITGTADHARELTEKVHQQYLSSGVEHSKLMVIHRMTHRNPGGSQLDEAIRYLDSRRVAGAPERRPPSRH